MRRSGRTDPKGLNKAIGAWDAPYENRNMAF